MAHLYTKALNNTMFSIFQTTCKKALIITQLHITAIDYEPRFQKAPEGLNNITVNQLLTTSKRVAYSVNKE